MIVDYNIEFGHLYAFKMQDAVSRRELKKSIQAAKLLISILNSQGKSYSLNVLLDDYNTAVANVNINEVRELFIKNGLEPDHIVLESKLADSADFFLKHLPSRFLSANDNSLVYRSQCTDIHFTELLRDNRRFKEVFLGRIKKGGVQTENSRGYLSFQKQRCHSSSDIVLTYNQGDQIRYGCPLLAACWHLSRLGIAPFYENIQIAKQKPFIGKQLLTVLPIEYMKTESTVLELMGLSKTKTINKSRKKMEYFFI